MVANRLPTPGAVHHAASLGMTVQGAQRPQPRAPARPPELPRVYLDTRMPPAPAHGGRVIVVGKPVKRASIGDAAAIAMVAAVLLILAAWLRWARHPRRG